MAHLRLVSLQTESYGVRMQTMSETGTNERFDAMQRAMVWPASLVVASLIGLVWNLDGRNSGHLLGL